MCEPTTLSLSALALGVGSGVMDYIGESQAADANAKFQVEHARAQQQAQVDNYVRTVQASQQAFGQQVTQINSGVGQRDVVRTQELTEAAIDRRKAQATARVAAGEAGVSGLSIDALLHDFERSEANFRDATAQQREFDLVSANNQLVAADATRRGRNNAARPQPVGPLRPVERPSFLGAALRIGGSALDSGAFNKGGVFGPAKDGKNK